MIWFIVTVIVILALFFIYYFCLTKAPEAQTITWGVDFSQMQAESLKLDWKKTFSAIVADLGVKNIKLHTQWDWVNGKRDDYFFKDIDWQIKEAEKYDTKIIYVVGMKTGRWPECHIPGWARSLPKEEQQQEILQYIEKVVQRYKKSPAIIAWQAENEPLFRFGECPWYDKEFLKKEVALIKSLDPSRLVIISDSGEQSSWVEAAKIGDMVGVTTYRKVWFDIFGITGFYVNFPIPAVTYFRKAQHIEKVYNKKVIGVELQAEPWLSKPFYDAPIAEQEKSMDLKQFKANVAYAKKTGLDTFYFWGVEWWYWLKDKQQKPEIWNEAKKLFLN